MKCGIHIWQAADAVNKKDGESSSGGKASGPSKEEGSKNLRGKPGQKEDDAAKKVQVCADVILHIYKLYFHIVIYRLPCLFVQFIYFLSLLVDVHCKCCKYFNVII